MGYIGSKAGHQRSFAEWRIDHIVLGPQVFIVADLIAQITAAVHLRRFQNIRFLQKIKQN